MNKQTGGVIIRVVIAAVGVGIALYAFQRSTHDPLEVAFKYPPNSSSFTNNTNSATPVTLNNSDVPQCHPLITNNTGTYCVTEQGTEFEPIRNPNSIYRGGFQISLCESFITKNSNNSSGLRFDKYQQPVIIVKRAMGKVAVRICFTSTVPHELLWHPSAGFPLVSYLFDNGTSRIALDEHVRTRLDKQSFTVPPFDEELLDYDNPAAPRGNYIVFIIADGEAELCHHSISLDIGTPASKFGGEYIAIGTAMEFDVVDSS